MEKWEYRTVRLNGKYWADSDGHQGELKLMKMPANGDWYNHGPVFDALGDEGWELVVGSGLSYIIFKRRRIA